ncbi:hypothetical protein [Streptomyces sp. NBC_01764]|uniref:MmyB family transcriptional regulator n=1 Tax=Streptomyces sp. NBC_01764 TaxID=2975935 RepID=UPI002B1CAF03|nr:hypothetical protein [Streptomyces sp. NBC_01764]
MPTTRRNHARYCLLDPQARERVTDWEQVAAETVAILRLEAGRHPTTAGSPTPWAPRGPGGWRPVRRRGGRGRGRARDRGSAASGAGRDGPAAD